MSGDSRRRGRRQKDFSRLACEFRSNSGKLCSQKYFADDKSKSFIRKILKDSIFDRLLQNVKTIIKDRKAEKMSSNKRASFVKEVLASEQDLIEKIGKNFLRIEDWMNKLEKYLKIQFCGKGSRAETMNKLLFFILKYIGLDRDMDYRERESEDIKRKFINPYSKIKRHEDGYSELDDLDCEVQCSTEEIDDVGTERIDNIQPWDLGDETESNRFNGLLENKYDKIKDFTDYSEEN